MPIRLPLGFPSIESLKDEGIESLSFEQADRQDIRPLKVVLFNLMPTKIDTEVQIMRLLSHSSIQIEPIFLKVSTYQPKHFEDHLDRFYASFSEIKDQRFDAIIITGAPVEQLEFEDVEYWSEFCEIIEWANTNVFASLYICWGAQAALYIQHRVEKELLNEKISGIYQHIISPDEKERERISKQFSIVRGLDDEFFIPQSRYTKVNELQVEELVKRGELVCLAKNSKYGSNILATPDSRKVYVIGHLEYDRETLDKEYHRDLEKGIEPRIPENYYFNNDPNNQPIMSWKSTANVIFSRWIDFVYQETPYDLNSL